MTPGGGAPTVRGMRGERGQTAAELLGGLLVVSVITAALATTDAGAAISREAERLVCEIAGGGCAPAAETPPMEPFEFDGPPLAGRTLPILPFPGSVTVACTGDKRQPETCVPKGQPGVSVQASGEIKVERTPTALDYNGCPLESMSIQSDAEVPRERRGQGREDRRPDPGPRRAGHEVPDHRHAGHGRGHRERPPQAAEPRRPALARPRREHPAQRGLLRRHQGQGHLQGAPGRARLRRRPAGVQRRPAHRCQQGARDGRRRGLRQAGAEVRRQVR